MRSAGQLFLLLMSAPSGRESHQPSIKDLMDAWMDKRNCIHIGLRRLKRHSHSMVPLGFGVRSKRTRFTPFTSEVIRAVISCSRGKGTSSTVAVMASTGIDCPENHRPVKGSGIVPHTGGLEIRHHGKILPNLALQSMLGKLLPKNRVGFPHRLQPVTGNGTQAANAQAGTGEGLTEHHAVRQTQRFSHHADFIFEEELDRFHQRKLKVLRQARPRYGGP